MPGGGGTQARDILAALAAARPYGPGWIDGRPAASLAGEPLARLADTRPIRARATGDDVLREQRRPTAVEGGRVVRIQFESLDVLFERRVELPLLEQSIAQPLVRGVGGIAPDQRAKRVLGTPEVAQPQMRIGEPEQDRLGQLATDLAIVAVATVLLFVLLRRTLRPAIRRAGDWSRNAQATAGGLRRAGAVALGIALNGVAIALAWIAGYALALYATGQSGEMSRT